MYEFNTTIQANFDAAVEKVLAVLMEEQLGIVSEVDVQATFKNKLEKDIPPYKIFGACNPKLADLVLNAEPNAGTLLPCNFIMREAAPGETVVSFMDPVAVLGLSDSPVLREVAEIAEKKLRHVVEKLSA